MERREFSATETQDPRPPPSSAKMKNKNKQRFSDEQIRLLESTFESETKLEPRKTVEVAVELGLHPRQVAIWFQNRRARGKSKQIEQDLRILKANYDSLASQFEILKEEKKALLVQVPYFCCLLFPWDDAKFLKFFQQLQKLNGMVDKPPCCSSTNEDQTDSRARHSLQEVEEAEMDHHPYDFQKSGFIKWIENVGCETEAINPDEHEEKSKCNTFVDDEGRQLWGTQHLELLNEIAFIG